MGNPSMAVFKYRHYLAYSGHGAFDLIHAPGEMAPNSGIYRCVSCEREITEIRGRPLPASNHHWHKDAEEPIRWQLIVTHS